MRKIISITLAVVLTISVLTFAPFSVSAAESGTTGDCTWSLGDDGTLTISGSGDGKIEDYLESGPWCSASVNVTSVVFMDGVTYVGENAFNECRTLSSIIFNSSITSIGERAFESCDGLTSVTIPGNVKTLERFSFAANKPLKTVVMQDGVETLGYGAFEGCKTMEKVVIPASVTSIDDSTFGECLALTIYGYRGTAAEDYANNWYVPFVDLTGVEQAIIGDANQDDYVTVSDATAIQKFSIGLDPQCDFNNKLADVDNDGVITVTDATCVQRYAAEFTKKTGNAGKKYIDVIPASTDPQIVG